MSDPLRTQLIALVATWREEIFQARQKCDEPLMAGIRGEDADAVDTILRETADADAALEQR